MNDAIKILTKYDRIVAALSLAGAGTMKLRDNQKDDQVRSNQSLFLQDIGIDYNQFFYGKVVHGANVGVISDRSDRVTPDTDALVCETPGLYIGITVADCFPVYFYDEVRGICAVAHAGWRGTVKGILPATIDKMVEIGSNPSDIHIEFGPGISQANFEFHYAEMIKEFGQYSQDKYIDSGSSLDKITIDLQAILCDQLMEKDIELENIQYCGECTFADERFFSARRHNGDSHGAMLAVIGMKE